MRNVFFDFVKDVGIFVIIGQTILQFGIGKDYEKYMKLVISFMVVAQIVFAFGVYLKRELPVTGEWRTEEYYENWNRNMDILEKEFLEKQIEISGKLQQRFKKQEKMIPEKEGVNESEVRIEKIVIQ